MGKPLKYTEDEVLSAIKGSAGIVSTIAKNLKCDWHTAKSYIDSYENCKKAYSDEEEKVLDLAESKLIEAINKGDSQMIKYLLATKGKKRGFTEKTDIDLNVDGGINIIYADEQDKKL